MAQPTSPAGVTRRIADHGVIGDGRSVALVATDGTVDWLCWPRFDSDAVFAALLDTDRAGLFQISPVGAWATRQRYVDQSAVLETVFERPGARVVVRDGMPVGDSQDLMPEHELIRAVRCEIGEAEVELRIRFAPRFAQSNVKLVDRGQHGIHAASRHGAFIVRGEAPLHIRDDGYITARFVVRAGGVVRFALTYASESPSVLPLLGHSADLALERSVKFWNAWSARAKYDGPYREEVVRSALTLKLLSYAPSGAMIAAGTTSLPERIGGTLNWDYRYCWLRDAAFMSRALIGLGYVDEAAAFIHWLVNFTTLRSPELRVLYDVYGERPVRERELTHFLGYERSRPVRIGNAAEAQLQLDVYGEVLDAVGMWVQRGGELDRETAREVGGFGRYVCANWMKPDQGIWEPRTPPVHHTHSRLLCWTALDRLQTISQRQRIPKLDMANVAEQRSRVAAELRARAWNPQLQSYTGVLDSALLDASALLIPWYGFERADSPRMISTVRTVLSELGVGEGLLVRNEALRSDADGGFLACGFWAAEALADGAGTLEEARRYFETLLEHMNGVGLLAEEIDLETGEQIGNFPQAFSHVGLISVALSLEERAGRRVCTEKRQVEALT